MLIMYGVHTSEKNTLSIQNYFILFLNFCFIEVGIIL
jgi:hypothetical protein